MEKDLMKAIRLLHEAMSWDLLADHAKEDDHEYHSFRRELESFLSNFPLKKEEGEL